MKIVLVTFFTIFFYGNTFGQIILSKKSIRGFSRKVHSEILNNLYQISDSLFRSEQPKFSSKNELKDIGIKSILNLRDDKSDSALFKSNDFYLYHVIMKAGNIEKKSVDEVLRIIEDAPKPMLIHCKHGADRTGLIVAIYRITKQGWSKEMAIFEMKRGGFGFHDKYLNIPKFIKAF